METGYFADEKSYTKVHVIDGNGKLICGSKISDSKSFQWNSHGIMLSYIECESCKKKVKNILINEINKS